MADSRRPGAHVTGDVVRRLSVSWFALKIAPVGSAPRFGLTLA
jgi:hypothetical protein